MEGREGGREGERGKGREGGREKVVEEEEGGRRGRDEEEEGGREKRREGGGWPHLTLWSLKAPHRILFEMLPEMSQ